MGQTSTQWHYIPRSWATGQALRRWHRRHLCEVADGVQSWLTEATTCSSWNPGRSVWRALYVSSCLYWLALLTATDSGKFIRPARSTKHQHNNAAQTNDGPYLLMIITVADRH